MATELRPGVITELMARVAVLTQRRVGLATTVVAEAIARQARINASVGEHAYGTPTPAIPGTGPAIISGTLTGSIIVTTPVFVGAGWITRIGVPDGHYPPYGSARHSSSYYGLILETGCRNGAVYPWLRPAGRLLPIVAPTTFTAVFLAPWSL